MSAYRGHRGPNVSQYIANLNTLSPTQDLLADPLPIDDDLSAFLNADFFDVNATRGSSIDFAAPIDFRVVDPESTHSPKTGGPLPHPMAAPSVDPTMDFSLQGDFQFTDFNNFGPTTLLDPSLSSLPPPPPTHYALPPTYSSPSAPISPLGKSTDAGSKKRKHVDEDNFEHLDANARIAAEEDKRRRNTAASARFRVKKKQREQALEKTAKDMSDKVNILETRIQQLETENAWLKGLITEKNSGKSSLELMARLSKHEGSDGYVRKNGARTESLGPKAES